VTKTPEAKGEEIFMNCSKSNDGAHDFDSNEYSDYCSNGCGESRILYGIKTLQRELATTKENLDLALKAVAFYSDINNYSTNLLRIMKKENIILDHIYFTDISEVKDISGNTYKCGGKLAREIKKQIEEIK
jgi:hypothetical protein